MPCGVCKSNDLNNTLLKVNAKCRTLFWFLCNELGKGRPGYWERPASETGSTDDGLLISSKNKHNPVMVYNDLMINNTSVSNYYINRSQPLTIQCPITWIGAPVDRRRQTGMLCPNRTLICGTSINVNYIYCLITLATLVAQPKLGLI